LDRHVQLQIDIDTKRPACLIKDDSMILPLHRIFPIRAHVAVTLAIACMTAGANARTDGPEALTLHYDKPAAMWTEALPIGNGRLGAMVFGRPGEELLQLNEATLWSGGPVGTDLNPTAYDALIETRKALADENYEKAASLVRKIQGPYSQSYLPLGDLFIRQDLQGNPTDYRRDLNIRDGIASTSFVLNGVRYRREVFASAPDQVIVVRLSTDKPRALNLDVTGRSGLRGESTDDNGVLVLKGKAPAGRPGICALQQRANRMGRPQRMQGHAFRIDGQAARSRRYRRRHRRQACDPRRHGGGAAAVGRDELQWL